jgi:hypothetical protein
MQRCRQPHFAFAVNGHRGTQTGKTSVATNFLRPALSPSYGEISAAPLG